MLSMLIREVDIVIQDAKLSIIVAIGCLGAACFNAIQFDQDTGLSHELRALQCIVIASGLLVGSTIKNTTAKGQHARKVWGFGSILIAMLISASKIFLPS
ncbi:hypothetical protein H8K35_08200 [Undibacterium sp. LX40W]|uniref:Uncharacterized protein n=1 Tax=Undibacterium nitidum TaxID=2762298 RepID=A0A923HQT5_9BURK|nr:MULTISPECIES: hypothetical protein [Undibacterium]MBC3881585.1 hypothetical protein [Undibacterium nitidum]MBC3891633.1 hypothetical protein [Undibacterium sp. LX40W]